MKIPSMPIVACAIVGASAEENSGVGSSGQLRDISVLRVQGSERRLVVWDGNCQSAMRYAVDVACTTPNAETCDIPFANMLKTCDVPETGFCRDQWMRLVDGSGNCSDSTQLFESLNNPLQYDGESCPNGECLEDIVTANLCPIVDDVEFTSAAAYQQAREAVVMACEDSKSTDAPSVPSDGEFMRNAFDACTDDPVSSKCVTEAESALDHLYNGTASAYCKSELMALVRGESGCNSYDQYRDIIVSPMRLDGDECLGMDCNAAMQREYYCGAVDPCVDGEDVDASCVDEFANGIDELVQQECDARKEVAILDSPSSAPLSETTIKPTAESSPEATTPVTSGAAAVSKAAMAGTAGAAAIASLMV